MIDESTDLSVRKNLYINSLDNSGDVYTYFAHISEVNKARWCRRIDRACTKIPLSETSQYDQKAQWSWSNT